MAHTTITSTSTSLGYWWERFGKIEGWILDLQALQGGATTANVGATPQTPTRLGAVEVMLAAGTADYIVSSSLQQASASFQASPQTFIGQLQGVAQQLLIDMANLDAVLPSLTVTAAFTALQNAMIADSTTISHGTLPAVGAQTNATGLTPVGNPLFVWSAKDSYGHGLLFVFPETVKVAMTQDNQNGATKGAEPYSITGQNAQQNFLSWDWLTTTYGSGAAAGSNSLIDPTVNNTSATGGANLTVNGTFTVFTATDQADNWTYAVGVATTNFLNGAGTTYYTGAGSLKMLSAGGTKNSVTQAFNTASGTGVGTGGTPYTLLASSINNTQYAVFVAIKMSGASPTNGTLTVDLIDGGATTILDDAAVANTFAIDLTAIADTNWHVYSGVFRLPQALPASTPYKIRLAFTGTILDAAKWVSLGAVSVATMTQFYPGGPFFVGFRGSTDVNASGLQPDAWTFAITSTPGKFQKSLWRLFNPPALGPQTPGLQIPHASGGGATVLETLVV